MQRAKRVHHPPPAHESRPSEELRAINLNVRAGVVTLGDLMAALRDRAYSLFILLVALPFCTPIPMIGVSVPFGAVIAYLGIRLALGLQPHMPGRFRSRPVPPRALAPILRGAERLMRFLERFMRPRFEPATRSWFGRAAVGAVIAACGVLLMLPLPIPASNFFPALTIVCLAASLTQDDGVVALLGLVFFTATLAFFGAIAFFGTEILESLFAWIAR